MTPMPESTKPTPSDLFPKYIVEGLQKQDSETLRAVADYAQDLRVYRAAASHSTTQAMAKELAAKAQ
ncbi:hypothetical protein [Haladaptatus litoreus]|uniref:hypothetical protein n=1 Tax=Haladaptatus litoreus TaxID=553468 RepID=UPI00111561A9|nr:hypothetical protein [Haladaptatus litoreus]